MIIFLSMILVVTFVSAQWTANLNNGLVSYWGFNEVNGNTVQDIIGGRNGTIINGTAGGDIAFVNGSPCLLNGCLNLENTQTTGSDGWARIIISNVSGLFQWDRPFTVSMWIYQKTDSPTNHWMTSEINNGFNEFSLINMNQGSIRTPQFRIQGSNGLLDAYNPTPTDYGRWENIVFVYNGDKNADDQLIYINGTSTVLVVNSNTLNSNDTITILTFGASQNGWYPSNAYFDDFSIWNRTLNSSEIQQIYNSGNGIYYEPEINESVSSTFNVSLNNPSDNEILTTTNVSFDCNIEDSPDLLSLTLIIDGLNNYTITNSTGNQTDLDLSIIRTFEDNSIHTYTCQGLSSTWSNTATIRTFNIAVPLISPPSDVSSNPIFMIMNSVGAGLGIFIQFMAQALPILLIMLALVGVITIIGYALVTGIKRYLK